jgi:L-asparagine oxygenase
MAKFFPELRAHGFAFFPSFQTGLASDRVVDLLGCRCRGAAGRVHCLKPAPASPQLPNTYSGRYGFDEFPFHTDLAHHLTPPPYILLRCIRGHEAVSTRLIDSVQIIRSVGTSLLARALVQPRRPRNGQRPLMSIWEPHVGQGQLRWDPEYLSAAGVAGEEAMAAIVDAIASAPPLEVTLCRPGDTLIVDNRRMLHARSPVPQTCRDRLIERVYLEGVH